MRLPIAGLMMVAALASATAHAKGPPEWKVQANAYKVKTAQPVNSIAPEEAGKIAADVAQLISDRLKQMQGVKVFACEEVTSAAFYAGLPGLIDLDTNKKKVQDGRWSPEYHFGYYSTPAGSYKYHKTSAYSFSDKDFSPVIRQNLSTDAVMQVNLFLTNARGEFRIQDMLVSLSGRQWEGQKSDMVGLSFVLENPNATA